MFLETGGPLQSRLAVLRAALMFAQVLPKTALYSISDSGPVMKKTTHSTLHKMQLHLFLGGMHILAEYRIQKLMYIKLPIYLLYDAWTCGQIH
jgi:hypothetical protein